MAGKSSGDRRKPRKGAKNAAPAKSIRVGVIDYKDVATLRKFVSERGKIRARRITGHVRVKRDLIGNGDAVLLVDDIVTTGATVRQCVQAFQQAGTKVVGVLVLADAVVRRSDDDING